MVESRSQNQEALGAKRDDLKADIADVEVILASCDRPKIKTALMNRKVSLERHLHEISSNLIQTTTEKVALAPINLNSLQWDQDRDFLRFKILANPGQTFEAVENTVFDKYAFEVRLRSNTGQVYRAAYKELIHGLDPAGSRVELKGKMALLHMKKAYSTTWEKLIREPFVPPKTHDQTMRSVREVLHKFEPIFGEGSRDPFTKEELEEMKRERWMKEYGQYLSSSDDEDDEEVKKVREKAAANWAAAEAAEKEDEYASASEHDSEEDEETEKHLREEAAKSLQKQKELEAEAKRRKQEREEIEKKIKEQEAAKKAAADKAAKEKRKQRKQKEEEERKRKEEEVRMGPIAMKERGNGHFKAEQYEEAVTCYQKAINLTENNPRPDDAATKTSCLLNTAACHLKLNHPLDAIKTCDKVLVTEPKNAKALYRRGMAYKLRGDLLWAVEDMQASIKASPGNKDAQQVLKELKKTLHEKQNEKLMTEQEKKHKAALKKAEEERRKEKEERVKEVERKRLALEERKKKRDLGRFDDFDYYAALDELEEEEGKRDGLDDMSLKKKKVLAALQDHDDDFTEEERMKRCMRILGHQFDPSMMDDDSAKPDEAKQRAKQEPGYDDPHNKAASTREKQELMQILEDPRRSMEEKAHYANKFRDQEIKKEEMRQTPWKDGKRPGNKN